jgi:hypothetical protein
MAEHEPRYWDAVEPIWDVINIYGGPDVFLATFAKVPRPVGICYAAHFCLSEVHNGGWLQFFLNSTGVLAPEAVEGFEAIGMPKLAATAREAMSLAGDLIRGIDKSDGKRFSLLHRFQTSKSTK